MALKYIKLNKSIKEMSSDELKEEFGKVKKSVLMRSIILNERDFMNIDYERSLRGFWYGIVKPTLDKLGLLTEKDQEEETISKWDAILSNYMAELVKAGELSYQSLNIIDNSRQRQAPNETYSITNVDSYGYKTQIAPYSNIIICTEKDTAYKTIKDLSSFFGCSCISGKGQNSLGAMEDLMRDIKQRAGSDEPIYILTMTDYDPAGYYIAETFKKQIDELKNILKINSPVSIKRIGITPEQLTPEEVDANKYTPKKANRDKWLQKTGGINGEPKGLELDAFPPSRIRELFIQNIQPYVDANLYANFIKESYLRKLMLEAMEDKIRDISRKITADHLQDITAIDYNLFELAQSGNDNIPVDQLCFTNSEDAIKSKVLTYFN